MQELSTYRTKVVKNEKLFVYLRELKVEDDAESLIIYIVAGVCC